MKAQRTNFLTQNKDIVGAFAATAAILIVPFVAMQFTDEVDWKLFDFVITGTLILATGLLIVLAFRKIKNSSYRIAVIIALLLALVISWAELAVGIFGTPFAGS